MFSLSDYNNHLLLYPEIDKLKSEIHSIVTSRSLSSFMNDTKWIELINQVNALPFPPPFYEKLLKEQHSFGSFSQLNLPDWYGTWKPFYEEGLAIFETIEYLEVCTRIEVFKGRLIEADILDISSEFENILNRLNITFYNVNYIYTIQAYQ